MFNANVFNAEDEKCYDGKNKVRNTVENLHRLRLFALEDDVRYVIVDESAERPD